MNYKFITTLTVCLSILCGCLVGEDNEDVLVTIPRDQLYKVLNQGTDMPTVMMALKLLSEDNARRDLPPPTYNLCYFINLSYHGEKGQIFCSENKGVPRIKMPQIKGVPKAGSKAEKLVKDGLLKENPKSKEVDLKSIFIDWLRNEKHYGVLNPINFPVSILYPTQTELVGSNVAYIWWQLKQDPDQALFKEPIFVSNDFYILDGHHRWAAVTANQYGNRVLIEARIPVLIVDSDIATLMKEAVEFTNEYGIEPKKGS